jgi:hypothetical protein
LLISVQGKYKAWNLHGNSFWVISWLGQKVIFMWTVMLWALTNSVHTELHRDTWHVILIGQCAQPSRPRYMQH